MRIPTKTRLARQVDIFPIGNGSIWQWKNFLNKPFDSRVVLSICLCTDVEEHVWRKTGRHGRTQNLSSNTDKRSETSVTLHVASRFLLKKERGFSRIVHMRFKGFVKDSKVPRGGPCPARRVLYFLRLAWKRSTWEKTIWGMGEWVDLARSVLSCSWEHGE